jgi:hypothetical protein
MSAMNILKQPDFVHLISDGASYDEHHRLVSIGPKVWPLSHINAAIGARGPSIALPLLAHFVGHAASSYDGLKTNIVGVLKSAFANMKAVTDLCPAIDKGMYADVAIIGFSERSGEPDAYVISKPKDEDAAWPVTQIPEMGFMPSLPEINTWIKTIGVSINELDPCDFGLRVLEMQRAARFHERCHVGGFAQITTVTRAGGINSKMLRHWNDTPGSLMGVA